MRQSVAMQEMFVEGNQGEEFDVEIEDIGLIME